MFVSCDFDVSVRGRRGRKDLKKGIAQPPGCLRILANSFKARKKEKMGEGRY